MLTIDFDRLGLRPGELLLDVGAGGGRHAREAQARGARVIALDLSRDSLDRDTASLCIQADALRLPLAGGCADRVILSEVLEHIPHDAGAIAEAWRVLRPGGRLGVSVPRWLPERVCWLLSREYHDVPGGHVRIYRGDELERRVRAAGFEPRGRHHAHALHAPYWWLRCLVGVDRPDHPVVSRYHDLLMWDMFKRPRATRTLEHLLNPWLGKSVVLYFEKPAFSLAATVATRSSSAGSRRAPAREAAS
jgi:SAM-dependent methyltransferase